jgi:drug/metabolite transporter (DMT)-like permease
VEAAQVETPEAVFPVAGWVRGAAWFGLVAVLLYVAGWAVAGQLRDDYDPTEQAISELFALGAPWTSRGLLVAGLLLSGIAFLWLAPALHRTLPGRGWLGPALVVLAGVGTLGVVAAPCTDGCPGADTSVTDTWHAITAGVGYTALVLAPLAFAWRIRRDLPGLARWSAIIGGTGLALFGVYAFGLVDNVPGLQQRVFNTLADAWYVLVAVWVLHRDRRARGAAAAP